MPPLPPRSPLPPDSTQHLRREFEELRRILRRLEETVTAQASHLRLVSTKVDGHEERLAGQESELESAIRRIRSETTEENLHMVMGIEAHLSKVLVAKIEEGLRPAREQLAKIDKVLAVAERIEGIQHVVHRLEIREDAEKLRKEEKAAEAAAVAQQLQLASQAVDIQAKQVDMRVKQDSLIDARIDGSHKRRIAWIGVIVTLLSLLLGGGGWTIWSHLVSNAPPDPVKTRDK